MSSLGWLLSNMRRVSNFYLKLCHLLIPLSIENGRGFHCGGSLISKNFILTAAHCVDSGSLPAGWKPINIRLGEWDLSTDLDCYENDCSDPHKNFAIEKVIVHDEYDSGSNSKPNDIALVKLAEHVTFTDFIRPLCLPWTESLQKKSYAGIGLDVAGWGKTEQSNVSSRKMKTMVKEVDINDCLSAYRNLAVSVNRKQLCAGGEYGIDTCRGDSGGGLVGLDLTHIRPLYVAVGVVSFGPVPCGQAGIPGVYTRVSEFVEWIRSNVD